MKTKFFLLWLSLVAGTAVLQAQGLDPVLLTKPATDAWPTYSGDYSARRFSTLTQINQSNVKNLGLAWIGHLNPGPPPVGRFAAGGPPTIVGGEIDEAVPVSGAGKVSGGILEVNGVLYVTEPDNTWAIDAHDGSIIWHYCWKTKGGTHIGNRGVGMYKDWLYFETPDDYLVSLDAKTGKERWHKVISDFNEQYFSTVAPIVIGNHLLVGTADDLDAPGFLQSFDPETGELQWKWYSEPEKMGDPGSETWPNLDSMRHGGAGTWVPGSYDADLHLYYFGTANPTPAFSGVTREGDNLYTSTIVALNVDTGKLAWYFQPSPHDTHDWDAVETPVLVDADFHGAPRKMLMQTSRNGYFFVLDRTSGKSLLTKPFGPTNWAKGVDAEGRPIPNPDKEPAPDGRLIAPNEGGLTNYRSPSFDPKSGLFLVDAKPGYGIYFAKPADGTFGWAGADYDVWSKSVLEAIDYQTGEMRWSHELGQGTAGAGVLSTDSGVLFTGDVAGNILALRTSDGKTLWHAGTGANMQTSPITYELDGRQYILAGSGGVLFAWALPQVLVSDRGSVASQ